MLHICNGISLNIFSFWLDKSHIFPETTGASKWLGGGSSLCSRMQLQRRTAKSCVQTSDWVFLEKSVALH